MEIATRISRLKSQRNLICPNIYQGEKSEWNSTIKPLVDSGTRGGVDLNDSCIFLPIQLNLNSFWWVLWDIEWTAGKTYTAKAHSFRRVDWERVLWLSLGVWLDCNSSKLMFLSVIITLYYDQDAIFSFHISILNWVGGSHSSDGSHNSRRESQLWETWC